MSPVARYRVEGASMAPAYEDGERLLINRVSSRHRSPRQDDVVVVRDPQDRSRLLLKRVIEVRGDGAVWVLGDNIAESRDSRLFGYVERRDVVGRVWRRY
jgi:nickel-type superoxide dismutase maturation protease